MDVLHHLGAREVQQVGIAGDLARVIPEALAAIIVAGEVPGLDRGPVGAVEHEDPFGQQRLKSFPHGSTLASLLRCDQQARSAFRRGHHVGYAAGSGFAEPVEEAALGKDAFEPLTGAVPGAIATGGIGESAPSGRPRPDRPLGKRGADLLAQVPLFEGLSRRHLKQIAEHADEISFRERETIVEAGEPGGSFFVIVEGEVRVVRGDRTIARAGPGEFFGEISLLDGGPRTASVIAETPVVAIRLFKASFDKVVRDEPRVAGKILAVVARRLREAERTVTA